MFFTVGIGFYTGLIQSEKSINELANEQLTLRRDKLSKANDSLQIKNQQLLKINDSIKNIVDEYKHEQDSVIKAYKTWDYTKQKKVDLKKDVLTFTKKIKELLVNYRNENELIMNKYWYSKGGKKNSDSLFAVESKRTTDCFYKYMAYYNENYQTKAIFYHNSLLKYLPNYKSKIQNIDNFSYIHPINTFDVEFIATDLEYMAYQLILF